MWEKTAILCLTAAMVVAGVQMADQTMDNHVVNAISRFSLREIRGVMGQSEELVRDELSRRDIEELRRRIEKLENETIDVRMSLIEAKLDAIFLMMKVGVGAFITYMVQLVMQAVGWFNRRSRER